MNGSKPVENINNKYEEIYLLTNVWTQGTAPTYLVGWMEGGEFNQENEHLVVCSVKTNISLGGSGWLDDKQKLILVIIVISGTPLAPHRRRLLLGQGEERHLLKRAEFQIVLKWDLICTQVRRQIYLTDSVAEYCFCSNCPPFATILQTVIVLPTLQLLSINNYSQQC